MGLREFNKEFMEFLKSDIWRETSVGEISDIVLYEEKCSGLQAGRRVFVSI